MTQRPDQHYWKSLPERDGGAEFRAAAAREFPEELERRGLGAWGPALDRRAFLKLAGFAFASAALTGCGRAPDKKAIPFVQQPEEVIPGKALWYASTCGGCGAGCGLLTRNCDGRPLKLEGNPRHPLSQGGLCAVGQASILGVYDSQRLRGPLAAGTATTWEAAERAILAQLQSIRQRGGAVRLLTGTITSPTARVVIDRFLGQFADAKRVSYDALSAAAILDAHALTHGARVLPRYRFDRAAAIVSIDADFLGAWISPVEHTRGYCAGRTLAGDPPRLSWHVQLESRLSLTGSKADRRIVLTPAELALAVAHLARTIAQRAGAALAVAAPGPNPIAPALFSQLVERLCEHRGQSLIVCGINRLDVQLLVNLLNHLLGNYGTTVDLQAPSFQREGDDRAVKALLDELHAGKVAALLVYGANPVYDLPDGERWVRGLKQTPLVLSFAERVDETAAHAHYVCPDHHYLESWADAEPAAGVITVTQPAVRPLGQTRAFVESLAAWSGQPASAYDLHRQAWQEGIFRRQRAEASLERFWNTAVERGYVQVEPAPVAVRPFDLTAIRALPQPTAAPAGALALVLYPKIGLLDGRHAHNPWLQELPDPVSKMSWDNYAALAPATAQRLGIAEGDVVQLRATVAGVERTLELPAQLQPGQHEGVVAVALGYGRKGTERFRHVGPQWLEGRPTVEEGELVGRNAAALLAFAGDHLAYAGATVTLHKTGRRHDLACSQLYHSIDVPANLAAPAPGSARRRPVVQETTLAAYTQDHAAGAPESEGGAPVEGHAELWPADHPYPGAHWGMAIDLHACTGCSACVVGCQAENNIPVVGKDEIRRQRDMYWIRLDRYYCGDSAEVDVVHQPMLCHHCENAPCETVCPVLATVHSSEGLNQQVYNRCVGTRYCGNNCPYKVRRFNWFHYPRDDQMQNLVLNPNVTVRSRGVMEKCSFCAQRIQEAKTAAKLRGAPLRDGDLQPACQQSCPAGAIVFGDLNDPHSAVARARRDGRHYQVLGELGVKPSVGYLRLVRHRDLPQADATQEAHHA